MQFTPATSKVAGTAGHNGRADFVEHNLLVYLRDTQNADGGWGFARGAASRVEPTAWALLALSEFHVDRNPDEARTHGFRYIETTQLPDGSWPAAPGQTEGSWVTALACWALLVRNEPAGQSVERGVEWLLKEKPADARFLWRTVRQLTAARHVTAQNPNYFGWSWTPNTATWVEPTAYSLIVLGQALDEEVFRSRTSGSLTRLAKRMESAEKMLCDRICPRGGWNNGNPMVYGVAGEPQVGPTVWALLALRKNAGRPELQQSLDWLTGNRRRVRSIESMALTQIALDAFGRSDLESQNALVELWLNEELPRLIPAAAWAALAMSEKREWLTVARHEAVD
jgi:hypothetical protein